MILADSSAWVEYDRATGSPVARRVTELIPATEDLAVTEPILMEVLAGARDEQRASQLRRLLFRCRFVPVDPTADFEGAALVYRRCRASGVTPRGLIDCLIAFVALRSEAVLLSSDVDMARISTVLGVEMDPASLSA